MSGHSLRSYDLDEDSDFAFTTDKLWFVDDIPPHAEDHAEEAFSVADIMTLLENHVGWVEENEPDILMSLLEAEGEVIEARR